jgi:hypothetical protein
VAQVGTPCGHGDTCFPVLYASDAGQTTRFWERLGFAREMDLIVTRSLGRRDAHDLALDLLAAHEGSALLANTMRDPSVLSRAAQRLNRWIDTL